MALEKPCLLRVFLYPSNVSSSEMRFCFRRWTCCRETFGGSSHGWPKRTQRSHGVLRSQRTFERRHAMQDATLGGWPPSSSAMLAISGGVSMIAVDVGVVQVDVIGRQGTICCGSAVRLRTTMRGRRCLPNFLRGPVAANQSTNKPTTPMPSLWRRRRSGRLLVGVTAVGRLCPLAAAMPVPCSTQWHRRRYLSPLRLNPWPTVATLEQRLPRSPTECSHSFRLLGTTSRSPSGSNASRLLGGRGERGEES